MVDREKLNLSNCDTMFISVNVNKQTALVPQKALVRYKFIEIIMKLAIKRYYECGEVSTELEAIDIFNSKNL